MYRKQEDVKPETVEVPVKVLEGILEELDKLRKEIRGSS